ncbi:Crp/Fnr family transcriptional regulator [Oribacterium sp. WCC10]|uniref:Crp/Fnr family transcriptional regulator n=1 Tax=Oribacterium sp. WCC10 TaxID=1855343 RepID=UPI0008E4FF34|nr:Crp/Fnr family transcriptional regulator [Oribacterium sp. WCC10]SFG16217.1 cAMP-binding domain of CRP or a regulatory subunit of cAMP-dependent protein kinases [Oribacterium sp. WCC10]
MKKEITYKEIPLFSNINEMDLNQLFMCLRSYRQKYKKGENIIMEQDSVQYIGVVLSGMVHMLKDDIWGNQIMLGYMEPGDLIGESFAVQKVSESYVRFQAVKDSEIIFLAASSIIHNCPRQCGFHSQITQNMFQLMGEKNVQLMEKIEVSSKASLRDKILAYLSMLSQKQHSRYVESPLSRTELAEYLCANRSAMTRELGSMKEEGILDYDKNTYSLKK